MSHWDELEKGINDDNRGVDLSAYSSWMAEHPRLAEGFTKERKKNSGQGALSITFFYEDGRFKAALSAKTVNAVAFYTFESLDDPWGDLERSIQTSVLNWRKSGR